MQAILNLFIMRQLLLSLALLSAVIPSVLASDKPAMATNAVVAKGQGTLEIVTPADWKFQQTMSQGTLPYFALHSPSNSIAIEATVYWDGIGTNTSKPTEANFTQTLSNVCVREYQPASVEKETIIEKLQGPEVSGVFARFTDAHWVPMRKGDYPNITTGMFRAGNLWGKFTLLTYGKDGPDFEQGLQVLESMRRKP